MGLPDRGRHPRRSRGRPGDTLFLLEETFRRAHWTTSIVHDLRDNPLIPSKGHLASVSVQAGSGLLGSDFDFVRVYGQFSYFRNIGPAERGILWASSYRAGGVFSSDFLADISDRFTTGGPFSLRGFETNSLGPIYERSGDPIGGRGVVIVNQELRFPLYRRLRGGLFVDIGNVFATPKDIALDDRAGPLASGFVSRCPSGSSASTTRRSSMSSQAIASRISSSPSDTLSERRSDCVRSEASARSWGG